MPLRRRYWRRYSLFVSANKTLDQAVTKRLNLLPDEIETLPNASQAARSPCCMLAKSLERALGRGFVSTRTFFLAREAHKPKGAQRGTQVRTVPDPLGGRAILASLLG